MTIEGIKCEVEILDSAGQDDYQIVLDTQIHRYKMEIVIYQYILQMILKEKLIRQLISKITEYFNENEKLEKSKFEDFIEFNEFPVDAGENKNNYLKLF